jgi:uncharacterized OB-fold protein
MHRNLPPITPLSEPFFAACREGRLQVQRCRDCDHWQFYPRILCTACGSRSLTWSDTTGRGRIASFTVVHRAVSDAYDTPFVAVLVDLDEGVRMMSQLVDCEPGAVAVGDPVAVRFAAWSEDRVLPVFSPVERGDES